MRTNLCFHAPKEAHLSCERLNCAPPTNTFLYRSCEVQRVLQNQTSALTFLGVGERVWVGWLMNKKGNLNVNELQLDLHYSVYGLDMNSAEML